MYIKVCKSYIRGIPDDNLMKLKKNIYIYIIHFFENNIQNYRSDVLFITSLNIDNLMTEHHSWFLGMQLCMCTMSLHAGYFRFLKKNFSVNLNMAEPAVKVSEGNV